MVSWTTHSFLRYDHLIMQIGKWGHMQIPRTSDLAIRWFHELDTPMIVFRHNLFFNIFAPPPPPALKLSYFINHCCCRPTICKFEDYEHGKKTFLCYIGGCRIRVRVGYIVNTQTNQNNIRGILAAFVFALLFAHVNTPSLVALYNISYLERLFTREYH